MSKMFMPLVISSALLFTVLMPQPGLALTKLQQEANKLKQAEALQHKAAQNIKHAQTQIKSIQVRKTQTSNDVKSLKADINSLENEIAALDHTIDSLDSTIIGLDKQIHALDAQIHSIAGQITNTNKELELLENKKVQTEANLKESEHQLQEAKERIAARNSLLHDRIRLMYINGKVSYLEVILHSTNFADFLERFTILKMLTRQDKEILLSNKKDHEAVTVKIAEIEKQLVQVAALRKQQLAAKDKQTAARNSQIAAKNKQVATKNNQLAAKNSQAAAMNRQVTVKSELSALKQKKEVQIAALSKQEEVLAHYTEQQEKEMIRAAAIAAASKKSIAYYKGGKLLYPLERTYRISSGFGRRVDPFTGKKGIMHKGIDFAAPNGANILAAETGRVITAGWVSGYGNTVILDHGKGLWTLYAHARKGGIKVRIGQTVKRGQKISEVGMTGSATGYHLHFEVRLWQKAVDPHSYLGL